MVNTVVPAADIVGPALAGFIADKIGNFRYRMFTLQLSGIGFGFLDLVSWMHRLTSLGSYPLATNVEARNASSLSTSLGFKERRVILEV